jgi:phosphate starvation-inducible protein PhoH
VKKEMEKDVVEFLELHGENEDNIKEIKQEYVIHKGAKTSYVVFKDEENVEYAFEYYKKNDTASIRCAYVKRLDEDKLVVDKKELKHEKLAEYDDHYFDFESK